MPSPNSVFTEMVTTTLRNHRRKVTDNISANNALLSYIKKNGGIKTEDGGSEIALPVSYSDGQSNFNRYSGYDSLKVAATNALTAAKYDWAQISTAVSASGRELRLNSGEAAMIKLVKAKLKAAEADAANNFSNDLYSDGSTSNQIGGLALLIQNNGEGTVGGINSATYTWWKNQFSEMTGTGTWSSSTIIGEMNKLWLKQVRGMDKPDLLLASHDIFAAYEGALQAQQRYASSDTAAAGFNALKYKSADIIFDSNANFGATAEKCYFLNTKYLYLIEHPDAQWSQQEARTPVNQDAEVIPILWMGQLVTDQRSLQGVLIDAA